MSKLEKRSKNVREQTRSLPPETIRNRIARYLAQNNIQVSPGTPGHLMNGRTGGVAVVHDRNGLLAIHEAGHVYNMPQGVTALEYQKQMGTAGDPNPETYDPHHDDFGDEEDPENPPRPADELSEEGKEAAHMDESLAGQLGHKIARRAGVSPIEADKESVQNTQTIHRWGNPEDSQSIKDDANDRIGQIDSGALKLKDHAWKPADSLDTRITNRKPGIFGKIQKAWPKDEKENQTNTAVQHVLNDYAIEHGTDFSNQPINRDGVQSHKLCQSCGKPKGDSGGTAALSELCPQCETKLDNREELGNFGRVPRGEVDLGDALQQDYVDSKLPRGMFSRPNIEHRIGVGEPDRWWEINTTDPETYVRVDPGYRGPELTPSLDSVPEDADAAIDSISQFLGQNKEAAKVLNGEHSDAIFETKPTYLGNSSGKNSLASMRSRARAAGLIKTDLPSGPKAPAPQIHSSVESFVQGLKALPKGSLQRGQYITAHASHPGFQGLLQNHPQGQQIRGIMNNFLNSKASVGTQSTLRETTGLRAVKRELGKEEPKAHNLVLADQIQETPTETGAPWDLEIQNEGKPLHPSGKPSPFYDWTQADWGDQERHYDQRNRSGFLEQGDNYNDWDEKNEVPVTAEQPSLNLWRTPDTDFVDRAIPYKDDAYMNRMFAKHPEIKATAEREAVKRLKDAKANEKSFWATIEPGAKLQPGRGSPDHPLHPTNPKNLFPGGDNSLAAMRQRARDFKLIKGWPKDEKENTENLVAQDQLMDMGGEIQPDRPPNRSSVSESLKATRYRVYAAKLRNTQEHPEHTGAKVPILDRDDPEYIQMLQNAWDTAGPRRGGGSIRHKDLTHQTGVWPLNDYTLSDEPTPQFHQNPDTLRWAPAVDRNAGYGPSYKATATNLLATLKARLGKSELTKAAGLPSFPKLPGIAPSSQVDVLKDPKQINNRTKLQVNAHLQRLTPMRRDDVREELSSYPAQEAMNLSQGQPTALGAVSTNAKLPVAYTVHHSLVPGQTPQDTNATQQHEGLHLILSNIEKRHGPEARGALVENLYNSIPKTHRDVLDQLAQVHGYGQHPMASQNEEKLALLQNYLNSSNARNRLTQAIGRLPAQHMGNKMKEAHRWIMAAAQTAHPKWLERGHVHGGGKKLMDWEKSELEKGWPKDDKENQTNQGVQHVINDYALEHGTEVPETWPDLNWHEGRTVQTPQMDYAAYEQAQPRMAAMKRANQAKRGLGFGELGPPTVPAASSRPQDDFLGNYKGDLHKPTLAGNNAYGSSADSLARINAENAHANDKAFWESANQDVADEVPRGFPSNSLAAMRQRAKAAGLIKAALPSARVTLPVGSFKDTGPQATRDAGKVKIPRLDMQGAPTDRTSWSSQRSGRVMDQDDGESASAANPNQRHTGPKVGTPYYVGNGENPQPDPLGTPTKKEEPKAHNLVLADQIQETPAEGNWTMSVARHPQVDFQVGPLGVTEDGRKQPSGGLYNSALVTDEFNDIVNHNRGMSSSRGNTDASPYGQNDQIWHQAEREGDGWGMLSHPNRVPASVIASNVNPPPIDPQQFTLEAMRERARKSGLIKGWPKDEKENPQPDPLGTPTKKEEPKAHNLVLADQIQETPAERGSWQARVAESQTVPIPYPQVTTNATDFRPRITVRDSLNGRDRAGVVLDPREVRTDGRGIPRDIQGAYNPINHKRESVVRLDNGQLDLASKGSIRPEETELTETGLQNLQSESPPSYDQYGYYNGRLEQNPNAFSNNSLEAMRERARKSGLIKGWPKDEKENQDNQKAFLNHPVAMDSALDLGMGGTEGPVVTQGDAVIPNPLKFTGRGSVATRAAVERVADDNAVNRGLNPFSHREPSSRSSWFIENGKPLPNLKFGNHMHDALADRTFWNSLDQTEGPRFIGETPSGLQVHDFTHALSPEDRAAGYKVQVNGRPMNRNSGLHNHFSMSITNPDGTTEEHEVLPHQAQYDTLQTGVTYAPGARVPFPPSGLRDGVSPRANAIWQKFHKWAAQQVEGQNEAERGGAHAFGFPASEEHLKQAKQNYSLSALRLRARKPRS